MRGMWIAWVGFFSFAAYAAEPPIEVTVALHHLQPPFVATSRGVVMATGIYGDIGIRLTFHMGVLKVGRGVPNDAVGKAAIDIDFLAEAPPRASPEALAYTASGPDIPPQIFVFFDRSYQTTRGRDLGALLGYVIAHELAHALGGVPHGATGIMKAHWDSDDLGRIALGTLAFNAGEIPLIRAGAAAHASRQAAPLAAVARR